MKLSTKILIGLILGIIAGVLLSSYTGFIKTWIKPFGDLFINLIKMVIVPLVLSSLVVGAASVGDVKKLGRMGGKTVGYYLITTAIAVTIGLVLANIIDPGLNMKLPADAKYAGKEAPPLAQVLLNIFPTNPMDSLVRADMLQIIVFALFLGIGITLVGERAKPIYHFFDGLAEVMYKITGIVMEFAPIGVFALITPVVAANGPKVLIPLAKVIAAVYIGCILHAAIVYSTAVKTLGKMSPLKFFKGFSPAMLIAFTTCSSSATLPVSMKSVEENLGVDKDVASFVLPLGATVNMDGTAIYQGVCAVFVAQVFGIDLNLGQQLTVILTGTLASIGAAGVPGAGLIMLTMVLQSINLPLEGIALIAGIDRVLDMARTTLNVTGDASAAVIVDYTEKKVVGKTGSFAS
ncbi:MAG: dicarboxylate/amino acid:cation symporter [Bacillota bacterium]|uniref:Cation:dicarboxylase symporter family transporter n=1 Tax=Thermanaerosceptrum fracticalcis TaxID=1712410 RepID=A0A7G6E628_THEFR|nr:dicarboxylate/amino acid:cation symporter [Thermanaerosceptrum fracticalcis]QNB47532.1 cation:dicarboxylase symporter family transporter [Thermanaerosceptrum fracticalcis]